MCGINKMNKKGDIGFIFIIIALLFLVSYLLIFKYVDAEGKACKELGFEDNVYWNEAQACKDQDGNIHFVQMDCNDSFPFPWKYNCEAKLIKVGEVFGSTR